MKRANQERQQQLHAAFAKVATAEALKDGACWLWPGEKNRTGYGQVNRQGQRLAHRAAWTAAVGPIPTGLVICHRCDTPACYRPSHLFIGTHADNVADRVAKGRSFTVGRSDGRIKLTDAQVAEIHEARATGETTPDIAYRYGVSSSLIGMILRGERRARPTGVRPVAPATPRSGRRVLPGKAAVSHCPQGHPYAGLNLAVRPNGHRWCRACARARSRTRRAA